MHPLDAHCRPDNGSYSKKHSNFWTSQEDILRQHFYCACHSYEHAGNQRQLCTFCRPTCIPALKTSIGSIPLATKMPWRKPHPCQIGRDQMVCEQWLLLAKRYWIMASNFTCVKKKHNTLGNFRHKVAPFAEWASSILPEDRKSLIGTCSCKDFLIFNKFLYTYIGRTTETDTVET